MISEPAEVEQAQFPVTPKLFPTMQHAPLPGCKPLNETLIWKYESRLLSSAVPISAHVSRMENVNKNQKVRDLFVIWQLEEEHEWRL